MIQLVKNISFFVTTDRAENCPEVSLKISRDFTFTNFRNADSVLSTYLKTALKIY